jgi:hypothetical protein
VGKQDHYLFPQSFCALILLSVLPHAFRILAEVSDLQLSIMGRPVVIQASEPALLATAAEAYGDWRLAGPVDGAPISLVLECGEEAAWAPVEVEVEGPNLRLTGGGVEGWADAGALTALCRVPRGFVGQPGRLASAVTDTLLLFLLTRSGRTPLHAAGVMCGETAVLLAGPSGSGKSTLSLAAMARGLQILSDDTVYIQLQPRVRIWGFPRPVHVFPADAPGFIRETRLRAGKLKAVVPVPAWSEPRVADRAAVVLLERGEEIRLEPVASSLAAAALSRLEPGFDLLARESAQAIAAVTAFGAWRLTLSRDPAAAVDALVTGLRGSS